MKLRKPSYLMAAFATAAALTLSGCSSDGPKATELGGGASALDLKGSFSTAQVFKGGRPDAEVVTISASALQASQNYEFIADNNEGALILDGNVPAGVTLTVQNARLTVNGNLGDNVSLNVNEPVKTHQEAVYCGLYCHDTKTVVDGLRYNDLSPAVTITGTTGAGVNVVANAGIVINGKNIPNKNQLGIAK